VEEQIDIESLEDELIVSDKLAFCKVSCAEIFKGSVTIDEGMVDCAELIDAAKAVSMVASSESHLANINHADLLRGDEFAPPLSPMQMMKNKKRGLDPMSDIGTVKKARKLTWKRWRFIINVKRKPKQELTQDDLNALMKKYDVRLKPGIEVEDTRMCVLCGIVADGPSEGCSRLLNYEVDTWVHLNCALWST